MIIEEGKLQFDFPLPFNAIKLDDTIYYHNHFMKIQEGIKAIDILAITDSENYMIEVKDYTYPETEQLSQIQLIEDIIKKIICSLSAVYPMSLKANSQDEKNITNNFLKNEELHIVFHIEIPPPRRGLVQSRDRLKSITSKSNIKVVSKANLQNLPWSVTIATP